MALAVFWMEICVNVVFERGKQKEGSVLKLVSVAVDFGESFDVRRIS